MLQEQPCGDTGGCRLRREWKHRQPLPRPPVRGKPQAGASARRGGKSASMGLTSPAWSRDWGADFCCIWYWQVCHTPVVNLSHLCCT